MVQALFHQHLWCVVWEVRDEEVSMMLIDGEGSLHVEQSFPGIAGDA